MAAWEWARTATAARRVRRAGAAALERRRADRRRQRAAPGRGDRRARRGRPPEVVGVREGVADAHRRGSLFSRFGATSGTASPLRRGDLAEAEERCGRPRRVGLWGYGAAATSTPALPGRVLLERGDLAGARRAARATAPTTRAANTTGSWLPTRRRAADRGRAQRGGGVAAADELGSHGEAIPDPARPGGASLKAEALDRSAARRGDRAGARGARARAALGRAGRVGRALRVLGHARARGRARPPAGGRRRARGLAGAARAREGAGRARLGAAPGRKPTDAREPLRRALELADVCGAEAPAEDVRSELHATGARPRRDALSGVGSLTAERAPRRRPRGRRAHEPRHRPGALRDARRPSRSTSPTPTASSASAPAASSRARCPRGPARKPWGAFGGRLDARERHARRRMSAGMLITDTPSAASPSSVPATPAGTPRAALQPLSTSGPRRSRCPRTRTTSPPSCLRRATRPARRAAGHRPQRRAARRSRARCPQDRRSGV